MTDKTVTVENNRTGDLPAQAGKQTVPLSEFITSLLTSIKERANV